MGGRAWGASAPAEEVCDTHSLRLVCYLPGAFLTPFCDTTSISVTALVTTRLPPEKQALISLVTDSYRKTLTVLSWSFIQMAGTLILDVTSRAQQYQRFETNPVFIIF